MPDFHLTTSLNSLLIVAAIAAALGLSFAGYRFTVPPVSGLLRSTLIIVRAVSLFLLFFLLGAPLLFLVFHRSERPLLALLFDQSKSMTIREKDGERKDIVLDLADSDPVKKVQSIADVTFSAFDTRLRMMTEFSRDSLSFGGDGTDLGGALRELKAKTRERNLQAVLVLSDGISTGGSNPLAEAEDLGVPVFTVGVGDTSMPRDLMLQRALANSIAYVGSKVSVNATLKSSGYGNERVEVLLLEGGSVRDRKSITLESGIRQYDLPLSFVPDAEGVKKVTVEVSSLPGELSTRNNFSSVFVKVLKSKSKILLLAGAPSADVGAVRRALGDDVNVELKTFIERGGGQFYEGIPSQGDLRQADCFVLLGYPTASSSETVLRMVAEQVGVGKGVFLALSRTVDFTRLQALETNLPFALPQKKGEESQTFFSIVEARRNSSILRTTPPADVWSKLPPAFVFDTALRAKPESEVLAVARAQAVTTDEPLLLSRRVQRSKSIALLCYGFWRWETYAEGIPGAERLFRNLMANSIRWLVTREEDKPVQVHPAKEVFTGSEPVGFTAQVYDENFEPIDDAEVSLAVTREGETSQLTLTALGNGRFEGAFDPLPEGDYIYTARAITGGKELAVEKGSFSVGGLNTEFLETRMNRLLLQQIAARTGGQYYDPAMLARMPDDLARLPEFKSRDVSLAQQIELWNKRWMMGLLVALFALEWFLRKRYGML